MRRSALPALFLALPMLAAVGCAVDAEPPSAESGSAITNAPGSTYDFVLTLNGSCTAFVLTQRFVLTAAHCFPDTFTGTGTFTLKNAIGQVVYDDLGVYAQHPNYVRYHAAHDIGVLYLPKADGVSPIVPPPFYVGPEAPWASASSQTFSVIGYGYGSSAGGQQTCTNLPYGTQRSGTFSFDGPAAVESGVIDSFYGIWPTRTLCGGDSGSPWLLWRNGSPYTMAVSSISFEHPNQTIEGTRIAPHLSWIVAATQVMGEPITCATYDDHRYPVEVDFTRCTEPEYAPAPPPPPPMGGF